MSDVIGMSKGHMQHLDDMVFELGVNGARIAIDFMRDVRDMLTQGSGKKSSTLTVKFDGAPAVFMGVDPANGKFFVAKKSILNKVPKVYYSHEDIDADTSGDLSSKLKAAFDECKKLGLKSGIYQGDIMFTKDSIEKKDIDGVEYLTFHPNTIVYAVPVNSALGKHIARANIGIVWHTTYDGNSLETIKPRFGKAIAAKFPKIPTAWNIDATFEDASGVASFTDAERAAFDAVMTNIGQQFRSIPAQTLNAISNDPDLLGLVQVYINSKVRAGETVKDMAKFVDGLYQFIHDRYEKEITNAKTQATKLKRNDARTKILQFFSVHPRSEILKLFILAGMIRVAKEMLIAKLNQAGGIRTFVRTASGFRVTGQEGFVALSDRGAVKLVDRLEFSRANFSPEVIKGWQR